MLKTILLMNLNFDTILQHFPGPVKLIVLTLCLTAVAGTAIWTATVNSDGYNCRPIVEENKLLHEDLSLMSRMVAELRQIQVQKAKHDTLQQQFRKAQLTLLENEMRQYRTEGEAEAEREVVVLPPPPAQDPMLEDRERKIVEAMTKILSK